MAILRDKSNDNIEDFESFQFKVKITGKAPDDDSKKKC